MSEQTISKQVSQTCCMKSSENKDTFTALYMLCALVSLPTSSSVTLKHSLTSGSKEGMETIKHVQFGSI